MAAWTIRDEDPADRDQGFPEAVPVAGAGAELDVTGASPIPGDHEAGAACPVRHSRVGGGAFLALHTWASDGVARARWRRLRPGGVAIQFTPPRQVATVLPAKPGGLAGAVAGVTHTGAVPRRKPPEQLRQEQPGEGCWRPLPGAVHARPRRGAIPGHHAGERPGTWRARQLEPPRADDPRVAPAIGGIAGGRAHAIAMPSLPKDLGARRLGDRLIAGQEHRPWRDDMVQEERAPGARERPGRPSAPGTHPMIGRGRPLRLLSHGAQHMREGASSCGQDGCSHQPQKPVLGRASKTGTQHQQYRDHPRGEVHRGGPSMGVAAASLPGGLAAISPSKIRLPNSLMLVNGSTGQKSS
jgi:hypothetical protein